MKIIWFVKVISRTRYSKKYLNKIGVNGKRVALITWPMTYLFGRSHMRVSWYKMKKKRHENKWCVIQWQLEIYKNGRFYKLSLKNCTIKPRNKKIKIKKVFYSLFIKTMKKCFYNVWAEYLILPKRLWKLVEIYWKPVRKMLEYDPSKVDDEYWKVEYLHYATWRVERKNFEWTIYCDYETAEKVRTENTLKQIWRVMQDKWYKIKDFEEKNATIEKLEKENEELKYLPPVNVETIHNQFDDLQDENLTNWKKRWRSTWEK